MIKEFFIIILSHLLRESIAGYCTQAYSCDNTCYQRKSYSVECGFWNWDRCTRYRQTSTSCSGTCYRNVCCHGYTGSNCATPICTTTCRNGGTCVSPDSCSCGQGFTPPYCDDIDECSNGNSRCNQLCTNTHGSYTCSCRHGFLLFSDRQTCFDINECLNNAGGCQHMCKNTEGSYECECYPGYSLINGKSCTDIDECQLGTSGCSHGCVNSPGSYQCKCPQGFVLSHDKVTCEDEDECINTASACQHSCQNTYGSYRCICQSGYILLSDGKSCQAVDPCATNNGGCMQTCTSSFGNVQCECKPGWKMNADQKTCSDIDECINGASLCEQTCTNTNGSFICGCRSGYTLANDGKHCNNNDDCAANICQHNGTCVDGINNYTCTCRSGFIGKHCETDLDECSVLNGGCREICTNTIGSFSCSCHSGQPVQANGSCPGINRPNVFQKHNILKELLPRGCFLISLLACPTGNVSISLSSTSNWYSSSNLQTRFTSGIVFIDINNLYVPFSVAGAEVKQSPNTFSLLYKTQNFGSKINISNDAVNSQNCIDSEFDQNDLIDFRDSGSILKSLFRGILNVIPAWLKMTHYNGSIIDMQDINSDLIHGDGISSIRECTGAPVFGDRLYAVYRFGSRFSLSVYNNEIHFPDLIQNTKFCLIVDICLDYGGTVILMVPEESRDILLRLELFKTLYEKQHLKIRPRGIGLSLARGIHISKPLSDLHLWNGDRMFQYRLPNEASVWIGGDLLYNPSVINMKASVDIYATVPSVNRMLLALFYDEWNAFIRTTGLLELVFDILDFTIRFPIADAEIKAVMSVGGQVPRSWCGDISNPPGIFFAARLTINPFLKIPILKDLIFDFTAKAYVLLTTDSDGTISPDMHIDIVDDILAIRNITQSLIDTVKQVGNLASTLLLNSQQNIIQELQSVQMSLQKIQTSIPFNVNVVPSLFTTLWNQVISFNQLMEDFKNEIHKFHNDSYRELITFWNKEQYNLKHRIDRAIQTLTVQMTDSVNDLSGFGFKFRADLRIFNIKIFGIDFEMVYSSDKLMQCSRFDGVKTFLKERPAFRLLGIISRSTKLCPFITVEKGFGIGMAIAIKPFDLVVQLHAHAKLLGITITADMFIYRSRLQLYIEGNLWGIFFAHLDITSHLDNNWPGLIVHGRLSAKVRRRRQIQTDAKNFEDSYLDGMRKVISNIAEGARKRLSKAQHALTIAQNKLTNAQNWLEEKKQDVRNANAAFDKAIRSLEVAKQKLEDAKGPFQRALEKLNAAQRKVDNLCRIRSCRKICIPGIKCNICWKKVWFVRVPYPCCHFTSCMISFPDPICVLANIACRIVRTLAYIALEIAKVFIRLPMITLDLAKLAVSAAQVVVDKSRVILKVAEGALDVAQFGLEIIKTSFEVAKVALEALRLVIGVAAKVLDSVIRYGLQNILDVRNCQFNIKLLVVDLAVFDVSCEVNAFNTGWRSVKITINFKNVLQSLWNAARATIDAILQSVGHLFSGRRRRDITFESNSKMHILLRKIRNADDPLNATFAELNDTAYAVNETMHLTKNYTDNFEERKLTFDANCKTVKRHVRFLKDTLETLHEIANESKSSFDVAKNVIYDIDEHSKRTKDVNFTAENLGINVEYAKNYNLSEDTIKYSLKDAESSIRSDTSMEEIQNMTDFSKTLLHSELQHIDDGQIANAWIIALENITELHFNGSDCVGFSDCVLFTISTLYDIFSVDDHSNLTEIRHVLTEIEDNILSFVQNASYNIHGIYNITSDIKYNIQCLIDFNIYCSKPPSLVSGLSNVTTLYGGNATFFCHVDSDPYPEYWWYRGDELINGERDSVLTINNITNTQHAYTCVAGNVVGNVTSNNAFISIVQNETDPCMVDNGGCEQVCNYHGQSVQCSCKPGFELWTNGITCEDINECQMDDNNCTQQCDNTIGSYRCSCFQGYHFDQLINMCVKDQDACEKQGLDCSNTSGCDGSDSHNAVCFCQDGYQLSRNGTECTDVDECTNGVCNQECVNTDGGYFCSCSTGFVLDRSETCTECAYPRWGKDCNRTCECVAATRCDPVLGCICEEGWRGEQCDEDINECEETPNICNDTMQECLNDDGFYSCLCTEGFTKNRNGICEDLQECSWNPTPCDHICNDTEGSFVCDCWPGYTLGDDKRACIDIKECSLDMHSCQHVCIETDGSYKCECRPGYTLTYDGKTCVEKPATKSTAFGHAVAVYSRLIVVFMTLVVPRLYHLVDFFF